MTHSSRKRNNNTRNSPPSTPDKSKKPKNSTQEVGGGSRPDIRAMLGANGDTQEFQCENFKDIGKCFQKLNISIQGIREDFEAINDRVKEIEKQQDVLEDNICSLDNDVLAQDLWARKWNIRFFGVEGSSKEAAIGTEKTVRNILVNVLKMDSDLVKAMLFQASHRLPSGPVGRKDIIIRLVNLHHCDEIIRSAKNIPKDCNISVARDLPKPLVDLKKKLLSKRRNLPEEQRQQARLKFFRRSPFIILVDRDGKEIN